MLLMATGTPVLSPNSHDLRYRRRFLDLRCLNAAPNDFDSVSGADEIPIRPSKNPRIDLSIFLGMKF